MPTASDAVWRGSAPIVLIVVASCVATADRPSPTDPVAATATPDEFTTSTFVGETRLSAFEECLGEAGLEVSGIPIDALGRPRMALGLRGVDLDDLTSRCARHLSTGALDLSDDPELRVIIQMTLENLADCLRSHGVESFPDPVPGFRGVGAPFPEDLIPWSDPSLGEAVSVCLERP